MTVPAINSNRRSLIIWTAGSLLLVAIAVGIVLFGGGLEPKTLTGRYALAGLACVAPYLIVLLLLTTEARPGTVTLGLTYALGIGSTAALAILLVVGTFGRVVAALTMWTAPMVAGLLMGGIQLAESVYRMNPIALMMLIGLGLMQFRVAKLAQQAGDTSGARKSGGWAIGRAIGFAMLGGGALIATLGHSHARAASIDTFIKGQEQRRASEFSAYRTMVRIQACAATYADSISKGEYPQTLAALGPAGSKCLDSATAAGSSSGYVFRYRPTTDSSGRNAGWWALALSPNALPGDAGLVADHTGGLYIRRVVHYQPPNSNRIDSSLVLQQPEYSELPNWVRGARCIRDAHAADSADAGYPSDLTRTERTCLHINRNAIVSGHHVLTYAAERPDRKGRFKTFVLHATELRYGQDAVRSFLIDADGVVHVTASHRPATSNDPVYVGCELDNGIPCRIAEMTQD